MNGTPKFSTGSSTLAGRSGQPEFAQWTSAINTPPVLAGAPQAVANPPESAFSKLAYLFLLGFLFVSTSRILDFTAPRLHLPLILAVSSALLTFISCGFSGAISTTVGRLMGLYTLWFILCVPFSQWKGGSFEVLVDTLSRSVLVFIMVTSAANTLKRVHVLMAIIGSGIVVTMVIALVMNAQSAGRLTMMVGQYTNPNDLAQVMLLGMCLFPLLGIWLESTVLKIVSYFMILPFLYTVFLTGSRGGLLTAIIVSALVTLFASPGKKLVFILVFPLLGISLLTVSDSARVRLNTLINNTATVEDTDETEQALESTSARMLTLQQSLQLTLQNPIFGVGPGVFQAAAADMRGADGKKALWVETHNAYTQVSSETGIPGAIFFCGAVLMSLIGLMRIRMRTNDIPQLKELNQITNFLLLGFLTFSITSLFSSMAYSFLFWMLLGLCATTISVAERELAAFQAARTIVPRRPAPAKATLAALSGKPTFAPRPATRVTLSGRIKPVRNPAGTQS